VRSDVERKRLAGLAATERRTAEVGAGLYGAAATRATYRALTGAAAAIVAADLPAIVDATFQRRSDRRRLRALARLCGARCIVVLCEAPVQTLRARVQARAARGDDASDATLAVLAHQLDTFEPLTPDELRGALRIDTDTDPATLAQRCAALAAAVAAPARAQG
jgi:predicted kinase